MAISLVVPIAPPTTTAGGQKLPGFAGFSMSSRGGNRRHVKIFKFTGQSGTLDTLMRVVEKIILLGFDGVVDATGTATIGRVLTGTFSTTIASLTDTGGYAIVVGLPLGK